MTTGVYRILDATSNRGREAIRVIEDAARFVCEDGEFTSDLKSLRHDFADLTGRFPAPLRMAARGTDHDVGTSIQARNEYSRRSMSEVATANFARLQESLRSIEEFSKMVCPDISVRIEQLRYRSYTLEQKMFKHLILWEQRSLRASRLERLRHASVYAILDSSVSEERFIEYVQSGVDLIQLRDKNASDRVIVRSAQRWSSLVQACCEEHTGPLLIMNDRADLAACSEFDGVHLGQDELSPEQARPLVGPSALIGVSTHNMSEVQEAMKGSADYLGVGPVYPTQTKDCESFTGAAFLQEVVASGVMVPVFAIGGIDLRNVEQIRKNGVRRVAVCSLLERSTDLAACASALKKLLSSNCQEQNDERTE